MGFYNGGKMEQSGKIRFVRFFNRLAKYTRSGGAFKLHSNMEENWEIFLKDEAIGNWNVVEQTYCKLLRYFAFQYIEELKCNDEMQRSDEFRFVRFLDELEKANSDRTV